MTIALRDASAAGWFLIGRTAEHSRAQPFNRQNVKAEPSATLTA